MTLSRRYCCQKFKKGKGKMEKFNCECECEVAKVLILTKMTENMSMNSMLATVASIIDSWCVKNAKRSDYEKVLKYLSEKMHAVCPELERMLDGKESD